MDNLTITHDSLPVAVKAIYEELKSTKELLNLMAQKLSEKDEIVEKTDQKLLTLQEACEHLQVTRNTVYRWIKDGNLSFIQIGTKKYFKVEDLESNKIEVRKPKFKRRY